MARNSVALRVGVEGEKSVIDSFNQIGDAGEARAARLRQKWERETAAIGEATERANRTAQRLSAVSGGAVDPGIQAGALRTATAAAREMADAQSRLEARTRAFLAALDPAYAAQNRFNAEMAEAKGLIAAGAISLDQYCDKLRQETIALEASAAAQRRGSTSVGQLRAGSQQLSYQIGDVTQQFALGTPAMVIFAQQAGQTAQAVQLMTGKTTGLVGFLGGAWGAALIGGASILAMFLGKILESNSALGEAETKLKDDARQTEITRQAKERYARTAEGVAAAIREGTEATDKWIASQRTAAEQSNIAAKASLQDAIGIRERTKAELEDTRARLQAQIARATGSGSNSDAAALSLGRYRAELDSVQQQLAANEESIAAAQARLRQSWIELAVEGAARATDPIAAIEKRYKDLARAAQEASRASDDQSKARALQLQRELEALNRRRDAEVRAEQAKQAAVRDTNKALQFGRQITLSDAREIAAGAGWRVTSSQRSRAEQQAIWDAKQAGRHNGPVAKPGTSAHETGRAIDVAYGSGVSVSSIESAFAKAGVRLKRVLDEPGQRVFHVEWAAAADASADATKRLADAQRDYRASFEGLEGKYDASAAAMRAYNAEVAKINALRNDPDTNKPIDAAKLDQMRETARLAMVRARAGAFALPGVEEQRPAYDAETAASVENDKRIEETRKRVAAMLADRRDDVALAGRDLELVTASDAAREREMDKLRQILGLKRDGVDVNSTEVQQLLAMQAQLQTIIEQTREKAAAWNEVRQIGGSFIDTVLNTDTWDNWGSAGKRILKDLENDFLRLALINPLKNALFGEGLPTLGSIGGLFKSGNVAGHSLGSAASLTGFATGTEYAPGGAAWVGENGRELVNLPRGSKVTPAAETRRLLAANDSGPSITMHTSITIAGGAGPAEIDQLKRDQADRDARFATDVVRIVTDAKQRRMIRS